MNDLMKHKLIKLVKERKTNLLNTGVLSSLEYTKPRNEQISFLNQLLDILEENKFQ